MSLQDFQIIKLLGQGSYASVYKVRRAHDQQIYAMKKVRLSSLSEKQQFNALNQIRILASISNPYIIAYKDAFIDKSTSQLCLVTELADDGDLEQKIISIKHQQRDPFSQKQIWSFLIQIGKGLRALHSVKIIHRDLKSANIFLFKNGKVKLGDMNVSKIIKDRLCQTQTGTPYYASPQIWRDQPYNQKSDIWSLGCIIYQMAALKPPFRAKSMEGLYKKVIKGIYQKIPQMYSNQLQNTIRMMLHTNMEYRPSIETLFLSPAVKMKNKIQVQNQEQTIQLINTIKVPKKSSVRQFRLHLPKPQYELSKKNSMKILPSIERNKCVANCNFRKIQFVNRNSASTPNITSQGVLPSIRNAKISMNESIQT